MQECICHCDGFAVLPYDDCSIYNCHKYYCTAEETSVVQLIMWKSGHTGSVPFHKDSSMVHSIFLCDDKMKNMNFIGIVNFIGMVYRLIVYFLQCVLS